MIIYLLIYIPFILSSYFDFNPHYDLKAKKRIMWVWIVIFTLFRGLRWETGTDWDQFYYTYLHAHWWNIFNYSRVGYGDNTMDPGYMLINAVFNELQLPYTIFLLFTNLIVMLCFYDFSFRHTKMPLMTLVMFLSVGVAFPVRQTLAVAIGFWGLRYLIEEKWINYLLIVLVAGSIHKGSYVMFAFIVFAWYCKKQRVNWLVYASLYASTYVIAALLGDYIRDILILVSSSSDSMNEYTEKYLALDDKISVDFDGHELGFGGFSMLFFFCLLLWIREKYSNVCNNTIRGFEVFFGMYAIAMIIDNLIRQSNKNGMMEILGRVTSSFNMLPLVLPLIFIFLILHNKHKFEFWILFSVYAFYKYYQQIPGSFWVHLYIPYKSILE